MPSDRPFDVAVIGAGASGVLVAAQFCRQAPAGASLALIGRFERPGRGVAYETPYNANLLNVPAGNMSAFPLEHQHFVRWITSHLPSANEKTFAPRKLYGDYLAEILADTLQMDTIVPVEGIATRLSQEAGRWIVHLMDGTTLAARSVVLAIGNLISPVDPLDMSQIAPLYHSNPWAEKAVRGIASNAPVLLIGSGLTMVDVLLSLRETGHRGPIQAVSRHGRLYQPHKVYSPHPMQTLSGEFQSPWAALRWLRAEITKAVAEGSNWRAVIDSLRPHTPAIWLGWSPAQRASFLRHARNLWDIHRHRMAPEIAFHLKELQAQGVLTIHTGKVLSARRAGEIAQITVRTTRNGETIVVNAARVINCTGPGRDYSKTDNHLVANLRENGWLVPDPLKLGIETDEDGRLVGVSGSPVDGLFTIGPLRIPRLWESIAIPEIRVQAAELAKLLVSECAAVALTNSEIHPVRS